MKKIVIGTPSTGMRLDVYLKYYDYMHNRAPPRARVQGPGQVLFAELEPIPDSYADTRHEGWWV